MTMKLPDVVFHFFEDSQFVRRSTRDLFAGKRVLIFGLPGAFTPTCSSFQLPGYDLQADGFKEQGIDEIWCTSVNDAFVMNAWAEAQAVTDVKMLPDGNGEFAQAMNMLVDKSNIGFGKRSWRYAMVVDDLNIVHFFSEEGYMDRCPTDPYEVSKPEYVYDCIKGQQ